MSGARELATSMDAGTHQLIPLMRKGCPLSRTALPSDVQVRASKLKDWRVR
jgi:hypothetical protein